MIDDILLKFNQIVPNKWQWVLDHQGFRKYFKNTGWMFFAQGFSVISLFVNIWVARYLGPNDFGKLSYALAFAGMFSFIANLGVNSILIRELVKYPEKRDKLMGTAFVLLLGGGIIAFFITSVSAFVFINDVIVRSLVIIFALTFILASFGIINQYFQANVQAKKNSQVQILNIILGSALKVVLILFGKGIIWLMLVYASEFLFNALFFIFNYLKSGLKISSWRFDFGIAKSFLSVSWLIMFSSAAALLYMRIDQVMIGYYLDSNAVGLYAAAVRLVEVWYFIPTIICGSLFPAIVNAKTLSQNIYHKRLKAFYLLLAGVAILIAIPSVILAPWFIKFLYGSAYLGSVEILRIYIWSGVGLFLTWGLNNYYLSENKLYSLFLLNFLSMLINVILNFIFIPQFGVAGAAWATLVSYCIGPIIVFLLFKYKK